MKKIYSFMLMATMLLIGTNAKAVNAAKIGDQEYATLPLAFKAAQESSAEAVTIELIATTETSGIPLNEKIVINTPKSITLDMKGQIITGASLDQLFNLKMGEFIVTSETPAELRNSGAKYGFLVNGTYKIPNNGIYDDTEKAYYSHLKIEENVKIIITGVPAGSKGRGIVVDRTTFIFPAATSATNGEWHPNNINHGLANGVIVDMDGDIEITGTNTDDGGPKGYGVQVTGNVRYAGEFADIDKYSVIYTDADASHITAQYHKAGFGAVNNNGVKYKFTVDNVSYEADASWKAYAPVINLCPNCTIVAPNRSTGATAMYAGGYAKWNIQCHAEGSSALVAKTGEIIVSGTAYLASTTTTELGYSPMQFSTNASGGASGVDTRGSAVVIESNIAYSGQISVTFTGDPTIVAQTGYAIEEGITTTSTDPQVSNISIQGGRFESQSGDQNIGCIQISTQTLDAIGQGVVHVNIGGGEYAAGTTEQQDAVRGLIAGLITGDPTDVNHTIELHDPTSGSEKVLIISTTNIPDPAPQTTTYFTVGDLMNLDGQDANLVVANPLDSLKLESNLTLKNLFMNCEYPVLIVVKDGVTMTTERIVMNEKAKIVVQAGGRLIVDGEQGVLAKTTDNLIIEAKEGKMGKFLFKPSVATNRHPHGTVELISNGHKKDNQVIWQRFGVPALRGIKVADIQKIAPAYATSYNYWDNEAGAWGHVESAQFIMKPFVGFAMTSLAPEAGSKYVFSCDSLYGSIDAPLVYVPDWNYFSNSYTAEIDIKNFVDKLLHSGVEAAIHVNLSSVSNAWTPVSYQDLVDHDAAIEKLAPMQCFTTRLRGDESFKDTINYQTMVWNPAMGIVPNNDAPARRNMMSVDYDKAVVVISNGENEQKVTLRQGAQFSNEFDNGADVSKFKAGEVSLYANTENGEQSQVATDNLMGQTLSIESAKAATFKMTFKNLRGETLAIRDNMTGSVINMTEGEEYFFSVAPGTTADRFEIVEAAKMPTDVEMLEAAPAKKGIYTIVGQYLGENFDVLPAGIYVVNGKKVVK